MEIRGKVIECLPLKSGQSAKGEWQKQEYILETANEYPKKICFMAWGDKIDQFGIKQGETITASIDLESREYNGRWYTDVKAWRISRGGDGANDLQSYESQYDSPSSTGGVSPLNGDDIPF